MMGTVKIILRESIFYVAIIYLFLIGINGGNGADGEKDASKVEDSLAVESTPLLGNTERLSKDAGTSSLSENEEDDKVKIDEDVSAELHIESMFETAKTVSLAPVNTETEYKKGEMSVFAAFSHSHRRRLCEVFNEDRTSNSTTDFPEFHSGYIFAAHLYEIEYPTAEEPSIFSLAIQCPTKFTYPRVFLRIPTTSYHHVKVVIVPKPEPPSTQTYIYSLNVAKFIQLAPEKYAIVANVLRKHSIFEYGPEKLSELCNSAYARFKYELYINVDEKLVGDAGVYVIRSQDGKGIYPAVKCDYHPTTMYLTFDKPNYEIKITFLDTIWKLINAKELLPKHDLPDFFRHDNIVT